MLGATQGGPVNRHMQPAARDSAVDRLVLSLERRATAVFLSYCSSRATFQYASLTNFDQLSIRTPWGA